MLFKNWVRFLKQTILGFIDWDRYGSIVQQFRLLLFFKLTSNNQRLRHWSVGWWRSEWRTKRQRNAVMRLHNVSPIWSRTTNYLIDCLLDEIVFQFSMFIVKVRRWPSSLSMHNNSNNCCNNNNNTKQLAFCSSTKNRISFNHMFNCSFSNRSIDCFFFFDQERVGRWHSNRRSERRYRLCDIARWTSGKPTTIIIRW